MTTIAEQKNLTDALDRLPATAVKCGWHVDIAEPDMWGDIRVYTASEAGTILMVFDPEYRLIAAHFDYNCAKFRSSSRREVENWFADRRPAERQQRGFRGR